MVLCDVRWLFRCFSGWRKSTVAAPAHQIVRQSSNSCAAKSIVSGVRRMTFGPSASNWGTLEEEAGIVGRSFALVIAIMAVVCHNNKNLKLFLFLENGENIMICKQKSCY